MAIRITDTEMTSDLTPHAARFSEHAAADGNGAWIVTWLPGRLLTHNQAVTAMTIAEMTAERAHVLADPAAKLWWHMDGWAEELGITRDEAVAWVALSPEDHGA